MAPFLTVLPAGLEALKAISFVPAPAAGVREAPVERRDPARSALVMATGTAASRLSGFARVLAVAWVLGQGRLADAYNQANTVPNTVHELLLGGVLSATLLPVLMQSMARHDSSTRGRANEEEDGSVPAVVSFLTVALVVATLLFWVASPLVIRLFLLSARGPQVEAERSLATTWLRLFTPQLLFMGLITVTTALLNARRRFAAVAFSPLLANLVTIGALVVADRMVHPSTIAGYKADTAAVAVVGIGTTAGYFVQLLAQIPALIRAKVPLRPRWAPRDPALSTIGRLSGWTVGAIVTNQVSYVLVAVLANTKRGNFSAFSYAYAFMLLPYAVVAVSIAYAVAPELAESWSRGDRGAFGARLGRATRATVLLMLPGGVGYALVARPLVVAALAHGHLTATSAGLTGSLLVIFALGLPGFATYLLLMRAFQSKQDMRSMFWLYVVENAVTVAAALALYPSLGVKGLTVAWIGAYTLVLPLAWWRLERTAAVEVPVLWLTRCGVATAVMGGAVALSLALVQGSGAFYSSLVRVVLAVAVGVAVFVGVARWLDLPEVTGLVSRWRAFAGTARGGRGGE